MSNVLGGLWLTNLQSRHGDPHFRDDQETRAGPCRGRCPPAGAQLSRALATRPHPEGRLSSPGAEPEHGGENPQDTVRALTFETDEEKTQKIALVYEEQTLPW